MSAKTFAPHQLAALLVGLIVIYVRYSSHLQREDSLEAQEHKARQKLRELGLDDSRAIVLADAAQRGDSENRQNYQRLLEMIERREVAVLIVDEQSRLSRGGNVHNLIQDLVFAGGRFIAVADGIDSARVGWEATVGLKGIVSQMELRSTGHRVRRSQELRASTPSGSAGDFPYGYRSVYENPQAAAGYSGRGPKPAKVIEVDEAQAVVVREVFNRFVAGTSIQKIAKWLNGEGRRIPVVGEGRWHHMQVRRMLDNQKYIGRWVFGRTMTLRNSAGRKKQVPVGPHHAVTRTDRPHLRLIDQATWQRAQTRLRKLADSYGAKPGQKRRGPRVHYSKLYPTSLLAGKIRCARCGSVMHLTAGGGKKQFACPTHRDSTCSMAARVPKEAAEQAVLGVIAEVLKTWPGWLEEVEQAARRAMAEQAQRRPEELETAQRRLAEVEEQVTNLVEALSRVRSSTAIEERLRGLEEERHRLQEQVEQLRKAALHVEMPTLDEIRREVDVLAAELSSASTPDLREMITGAVAEDVAPPRGKKRPWSRLRFRVDGLGVLRWLLGDRLPPSLEEMLTGDREPSTQGDEFSFEFGRKNRLDELAPQIVQLRGQGWKWIDIAEITGLRVGTAYAVHKRWAAAG